MLAQGAAGATCAALWPTVGMAVAFAAVVTTGLVWCVPGAGPACALGAVAFLSAAGVAWARMEATRVPTVPASGALNASVEVTGGHAPTRHGWRVTALINHAPTRPDLAGRRVFLQLRGMPPQVGAWVTVDGTLGPAAGPQAPEWWRNHCVRQQIVAAVRVQSWQVVGARGGVRGVLDRLSRNLRARIDASAHGDDAAVVSGVVLGFDERLSEPRRDAFRRAGLAHLLAVSGQNVVLIGLCVVFVLRAAGLAQPLGLVAAAVAMVAYAALCQPGASVTRATVTGVLVVAALVGGRPRRRMYPMLLTFAAMVMWEPRGLGDPGLLLSFSAVVGILVLAPRVTDYLSRVMPGSLAAGIAVSLAASCATAPVALAVFGEVSVVGVITNLVAVPVAGLVLICGLVGASLGLAIPPLGALALLPAAGGARLLNQLADTAARVPGATVDVWGVAAVLAVTAVAVGGARVRRGASIHWPDAARAATTRLRDLR